MAKRKYSGKRNRIEPAVQTFTFATASTSAGGSTISYIDLSQVASIMNRRFYRQGINWAVAGIKFITAQPSPGNQLIGSVTVEKLPNTWVMANSWTKSFRAWQRMIEHATEDSGTSSIKGRFLDFKVFADSVHHTAGFAANLLPRDATGPAIAGEWIPSKFQLPNAFGGISNPTDILAVGPNFPGVSPATGANAVSMIQGYADSRALPYQEDPNVPADADTNWMVRLFNDGSQQDQEVIAELEVAGDQAPYPYEGDGTNLDTMYPGGETQLASLQLHDLTSYGATTISGTTRVKGGNFPCGLMKITHSLTPESTPHNVLVQVDLVPGSHRGYLCETMLEM